jgi:uncharacterized membrane protein YhdT
MTMCKIIGWALVAALAAAVITGLPDIKRYFELRSM